MKNKPTKQITKARELYAKRVVEVAMKKNPTIPEEARQTLENEILISINK
jgi:hypothetical protein